MIGRYSSYLFHNKGRSKFRNLFNVKHNADGSRLLSHGCTRSGTAPRVSEIAASPTHETKTHSEERFPTGDGGGTARGMEGRRTSDIATGIFTTAATTDAVFAPITTMRSQQRHPPPAPPPTHFASNLGPWAAQCCDLDTFTVFRTGFEQRCWNWICSISGFGLILD